MSKRSNYLEEIAQLIHPEDIAKSISNLANAYSGEVVFSTSFSWEDQLISHIIFKNDINVDVFTLDTGRLFSETYTTWNNTVESYQKKIKAYYPLDNVLEDFVSEKGPNSFYESVENRKRCCAIRKIEPLQRALQGRSVWITGIRAAHSNGRSDMPLVEYDAVNDIVKYHPLLHWATEEVTNYIKLHDIPYNPLHDKGFVSIGCLPCTRAIRPGEDFRAGRWWWEGSDKKECGLHVHDSHTPNDTIINNSPIDKS